jgi:transposase
MTFTPEESGEIFKRDKMGRVRVPRARREALLDEYERSGISGVQFANYVGIKYSTLANWIQERRGRGRFDKSQKSISLAKRAEATYAEYRRQKASALGGREFRLPLC